MSSFLHWAIFTSNEEAFIRHIENIKKKTSKLIEAQVMHWYTKQVKAT